MTHAESHSRTGRRLIIAMIALASFAATACEPEPSSPTTTTTAKKPVVTTTTTAAPRTTTTTAPTTTVAPTTTTTTTTAPTTTTTVTTVPSSGTVLWLADADTDTDHGEQTDCLDKNTGSLPTTRLSIVDDPAGLHGNVYRAHLTEADIDSGQNRAEWKDPYANCDGATDMFLWEGTDRVRYVGWSSLFGGDVTLDGADNGGNYLQWKGDSSCGGPSVGMTIRDNRLTLRTIDGDHLAWDGPLMSTFLDGEWHDFVMAVNMSKTTGWIEFWVDGQPQTMTDGTTRWAGPTVCPNDAEVWTKWGVYGMDSGAPTHWLSDPRIGTSLAAVTP